MAWSVTGTQFYHHARWNEAPCTRKFLHRASVTGLQRHHSLMSAACCVLLKVTGRTSRLTLNTFTKSLCRFIAQLLLLLFWFPPPFFFFFTLLSALCFLEVRVGNNLGQFKNDTQWEKKVQKLSLLFISDYSLTRTARRHSSRLLTAPRLTFCPADVSSLSWQTAGARYKAKKTSSVQKKKNTSIIQYKSVEILSSIVSVGANIKKSPLFAHFMTITKTS